MKKLLLGLVAIIAMALCFTACNKDDENEPKKADPTETGTNLYDSYKQYQEADENTEEGKATKILAAAKMYTAYKAYDQNKEDAEWQKTFAKSAVTSALEVDANEQLKDALTNELIEKLQDGTLVSEDTGNKVVAVAGLAKALNEVFTIA